MNTKKIKRWGPTVLFGGVCAIGFAFAVKGIFDWAQSGTLDHMVADLAMYANRDELPVPMGPPAEEIVVIGERQPEWKYYFHKIFDMFLYLPETPREELGLAGRLMVAGGVAGETTVLLDPHKRAQQMKAIRGLISHLKF